MLKHRIVIGTRGSKLARAQAEIIAQRLLRLMPSVRLETRIIVTTGDRDQKSLLSSIGGKGIFIRELEQALIDGSIDIAVHSFKDVTTELAPSLKLAGFLLPESVADVMVTHGNLPLDHLPHGARIGTGSMRRKVLLQRLRPDLQITDIRGNIDTRMAKVDRKEYDGIMLSEAGLIRLGLEERITVRFDPTTFYPAPGQGIITLETRGNDEEMCRICSMIGDPEQYRVSTAELSLLDCIGFDCRTPFGVYSSVENGRLTMRGFFVDNSTGEFRECRHDGPLDDASAIGTNLGLMLLQSGNV